MLCILCKWVGTYLRAAVSAHVGRFLESLEKVIDKCVPAVEKGVTHVSRLVCHHLEGFLEFIRENIKREGANKEFIRKLLTSRLPFG